MLGVANRRVGAGRSGDRLDALAFKIAQQTERIGSVMPRFRGHQPKLGSGLREVNHGHEAEEEAAVVYT